VELSLQGGFFGLGVFAGVQDVGFSVLLDRFLRWFEYGASGAWLV
jgi:hypothetical protein